MSTNPLGDVRKTNAATEAALKRMLAARDSIRRQFFSDEAMAIPFPEDAPEVVGIHSPEVMRDARKRRAAG